jgi:ubiquinone/menaquinone biosynthesis C-methylase UbiE
LEITFFREAGLNALISLIGNALSLGVGTLVGSQAALRTTQNLQPYPMPHQLAQILDHSLRLRYLQPAEVLGMYGVTAGMAVLDAGCGSGLFTQDMAHMVGAQGVVHAVDLQAPMLTLTRRRLVAANLLDRAQLHLKSIFDLPLADDSIDLAIAVSTLGEIPDKPAALSELRRVLKPGGRLGVTEEALHPAYLLPGSLQRWVEEAGFRQVGRTGSPFCYHAIFVNEK